MPVECQQRLYWLEPEVSDHYPSASVPRTVSLVSAPLDLSSSRREGTIRVRGNFTTSLFSSGHALYLLFYGDLEIAGGDPLPPPRSTYSIWPQCLYRIAPGEPFAVTKLATFPKAALAFWLDGGNLYAVATEERGGWFDWLGDGSQATAAKVAYRFRLPD